MQEIYFGCSIEETLADARKRVHVHHTPCDSCGSYAFVGISPHPEGPGTICECDLCFAKRRFVELVGAPYELGGD